jgi:hypothetical protein
MFVMITLTVAWYQNRPTLAGKPRLSVLYGKVKGIFAIKSEKIHAVALVEFTPMLFIYWGSRSRKRFDC